MIGFLISLPLRILFGVFSLFLTIITLPLRLLIHNIWLVVILVLVLLAYYAFEHSRVPAQVTPAKTAGTTATSANPIVVDPVRVRQNGDSAFASDLYASMNDPERAYYSQLFFWVMSNTASGKSYVWSNGNINGEIIPYDSFLNASNATCRRFSETLKVHDTLQHLTGIACQQASGKWCKLKPNATPACGLGRKHNALGDALGSLKNLF